LESKGFQVVYDRMMCMPANIFKGTFLREHSGKFAQGFRITGACTGYGWCERNCPLSNIKIPEETSKPVFLNNCVICTRCVYGCPARAIRLNGGKADYSIITAWPSQTNA
jgi:ferredoxin